MKGYTEEHLSQLVQASSQELSHYLARAHILHIGHRLRPVAPSYLPPFLSSLLLAADDKTGTATAEAFAQEADLDDLSIARQVLAWYTTSSSSSLDKTQIVKDIGSALLQSWPAQDFRSALTLPGSGMAAAASKKRVIPLSKLLERWKKWAGSDEHLCSADLLKVLRLTIGGDLLLLTLHDGPKRSRNYLLVFRVSIFKKTKMASQACQPLSWPFSSLKSGSPSCSS